MSGALENGRVPDAASEQSVAPHAGVVTAVGDGVATVRFVRNKMCAHCGACISVGEKELEMTVPNALDAEVGDLVDVSLPPHRVVQASLLAYVVPLVALLVGVWLGSLVSDLFALLFGVLGCGVAYLILRMLEKKRKLHAAFQPRMTRILPPEQEAGHA